ncbi:MAG: hypothetical protein IPG81_04545 [Sandaracinaceae bacterium]|nr:hypothetical protein [Sandaracinaceae bacterium]
MLLYAQRQVAQHCLYGVDKNPLAVDLGKLSLWLATLARDHAFTFLDHSIRHGDSLVGLTREQIASFHWAPEKQIPVVRKLVDEAIAEAMALRAKIPDLANSDDVGEKRQLLRDADDALQKIRMLGDAIVASFFAEDKPRARDEARERWETETQNWLSGHPSAGELPAFVEELRSGERPVPCFHWAIEFPEVFDASGGFDAILGNPPFLGGTRISTHLACSTFLAHNALSRCRTPLRIWSRTFPARLQPPWRTRNVRLLATKTISQGDSRAGGLAWICRNKGTIYEARRRFRWPGTAAVMVSAVHVAKGRVAAPYQLDHRPVEQITGYLFHRGGSEDPARLPGQNELFSIGSKIYGQGFLFADDEPKASPVSLMRSILASRPSSADRIRPFLGGVELNQSPSHASYRWVIDVNPFEEEEIRERWPELMAVIEQRVRPERERLGANPNNVAPGGAGGLTKRIDRISIDDLRRLTAQLSVHKRVSIEHLCSAQAT